MACEEEGGALLEVCLQPAGPLWQRVPTRSRDGEPLNDFMMLIPRLREWPEVRRLATLQALEQLLREQADKLVLVDLNLKLNLLWISMRPDPAGCLGMAAAIKARVPEAVLVANRAEVLAGAASRRRRRPGRFLDLCSRLQRRLESR